MIFICLPQGLGIAPVLIVLRPQKLFRHLLLLVPGLMITMIHQPCGRTMLRRGTWFGRAWAAELGG